MKINKIIMFFIFILTLLGISIEIYEKNYLSTIFLTVIIGIVVNLYIENKKNKKIYNENKNKIISLHKINKMKKNENKNNLRLIKGGKK